MCLILFSFDPGGEYPVVVAANRDEFYERPTQSAHFWQDAPHIFAGRDLTNHGTWLGVDRYGRFAAVANYRDPSSHLSNALSRGWLVSDYLIGRKDPEVYLRGVQEKQNRFNGFNLIVGDIERIGYLSSTIGAVRMLSPGLYGLSNGVLDTPWPKVERGKAGLRRVLNSRDRLEPIALFDVLADSSFPGDTDLPDTGVGIEWERILAPIFVSSPTYGTRCSTVLIFGKDGTVRFAERSFDREGHETETVSVQFEVEEFPVAGGDEA
jgi:uncharacterized protein with NRDE domain